MTAVEALPVKEESVKSERIALRLPRDDAFVYVSSENHIGLRRVLNLLTGGNGAFLTHEELVVRARHRAHREAKLDGVQPPDPATITAELPALAPTIGELELKDMLGATGVRALIDPLPAQEANLLVELSVFLGAEIPQAGSA